MALYGIGYIARMTRASMAEVMTAQYIRTARLKGLSFARGGHEARPAQRADRAVHGHHAAVSLAAHRRRHRRVHVQLQGLRLHAGEAADNNDIDLVLACGLVSVVLVLLTQLISDIGYAFLNPRISVIGSMMEYGRHSSASSWHHCRLLAGLDGAARSSLRRASSSRGGSASRPAVRQQHRHGRRRRSAVLAVDRDLRRTRSRR